MSFLSSNASSSPRLLTKRADLPHVKRQRSGVSTQSPSRPQKRTRTQSTNSKKNGSHVDPTLLVLLFVLMAFGLVMLSSASFVIGHTDPKIQDGYYYIKHQLLNGVFLGLVSFYVMSKINYHYWRKYAFPLVIVSMILLFAVFIPGIGSDALLGAKRWIHIGGLFFQPSEVVKLSFLIYLAAWLEKRGKQVEDFSYGLVSFLTMLGFIVLLIAIAQKDLGTTMVIAVISIVVYFVAGAPWRHLGLIFLGGIASFLVLIKIAPYRVARLSVFLNPEIDPQGIGYHVNQALLAIGSGGFFGLGLNRSIQKYNYLPEPATDSIFAVIAEELGFFFSLAVVLLFVALVLQALKIARQAPDQFGRLIAVGIATWVGFQAFINIGAMLSIVPLTGIPLPFISYGSSSMIMLLTAMGLLANISRRTTSKATH